MGEKVLVHIDSQLFPAGTTIHLDSWQIQDEGERVHFPKETTIGDVMIPSDTVLFFETPYKKGTKEITAKAVRGTWSLHAGIHRRTLMSRDDDWSYGFESLDALKVVYARHKASLARFGYVCWFAYAIPPGGMDKDKVQIDEPVPHSR